MHDLLSTIADPRVGADRLAAALRQLGPPAEPASFWSTIANDDVYRPEHRRRAVFELFRRHVRAGVTVAGLALLLDNPRWLRDEDVAAVDALGGKIPVQWTAGDTVFVIAVFPWLGDRQHDHWAVYLRVAGDVDRRSFADALQGRPVPDAVRAARLIELGLSPRDPGSESPLGD